MYTYLKPDRYLCWNIADIKVGSDKYIPLEQDLVISGLSVEKIEFMLTNNKTIQGITDIQLVGLQSMFEIYNSTMVGASGAIMGVMVAFGMLYPNAELMLIFLPIPVKAKYFIPAIIGLDLISAFTGQSFFSPSNTAYAAHVGGALTGFLIMWYWKKTQFNNKRWDI